MTERIWTRFLTDADKEHLAASAPQPPVGFGQRAAVLSVDNYRSVVGDTPEPLLDSIKKWPKSTGMAGWAALGHIAELFQTARECDVPIIHVTALAEEESGFPSWSRAIPRLDSPDARDRYRRRFDFVPQASPIPGEAVFRKTAPSAFFGTPLAAYLNHGGIDTLIVCGESASGCVRASVVDGCSYRLRMIVVEDCVYDRHESARAINLFDMHQKYADVLSLSEVLSWMRSHRNNRETKVGQTDPSG
jgi:nicotinamidase-related amidase